MHLFLIRHGETEHNVAGLLAGVTDSKLTNHGVLQTQKLAWHLIADRKLRFTHIYSSDLQRAFMTADETRKAQNNLEKDDFQRIDVVKLEILREQDFGSFELVSWSSRHASDASKSKTPDLKDPDFKPKETKDAMRLRADSFLDDYIVPLFAVQEELTSRIAIVSHGLLLGCLWRALLHRFRRQSVFISPEAGPLGPSRALEYLPSWTNTGYLELDIQHRVATPRRLSETEVPADNKQPENLSFEKALMKVLAVNAKPHLLSLKRTRGGVGSSAYDQRQRTIEGFFKQSKRPKLEVIKSHDPT